VERRYVVDIDTPLDHSACNQFVSRGVSHGDTLYVASSLHGKMVLVARFVVDDIVSQRTAERRLRHKLWTAAEHAMAIPGTGARPRIDRFVDDSIVASLRFIMADGSEKPPLIHADGRLDQQTLRSLRRLSPASAKLLDSILDTKPSTTLLAPSNDEEVLQQRTAKLLALGVIDVPAGSANPKKSTTSSTVYARLPAVRAFVLSRAKGRCELCKKDAPFLDSYGNPYLEVHHVRWLSDAGSDTHSNAVALCPNCHRRCHVSLDRDAAKKELLSAVKSLVEE